ncbi:MAG TPA: DUF3575 domain-containing protein [Flavisolibacter sp.]
MKAKYLNAIVMTVALVAAIQTYSQTAQGDSTKMYKNVVRYNLSGAMFFGVDKYIVVGYERVLTPRKSVSINFGAAAMPKLVSISTDSFQIEKSGDRKGYNFSVDYRFYLGKENKFSAPHGLYIGPYYSYNHFDNKQEWSHTTSTGTSLANSSSKFNIHTFGFELGYQFIIWKHFALDLVMIGPGLGFYKYESTITSNLTEEQKAQLRETLKQTLTQKFPGMNYVFSDQTIDADGVMKTSNIGFRYIIHIGYNF